MNKIVEITGIVPHSSMINHNDKTLFINYFHDTNVASIVIEDRVNGISLDFTITMEQCRNIGKALLERFYLSEDSEEGD